MSNETPKFVFKQLNVVTSWSYNFISSNCGICRGELMDICYKCKEGERDGNCIIAQGSCGHAFHDHCVENWIRQHHKCPTCKKDWDYEKTIERDFLDQ